jgi:hypothetical protein
VLLGLFAAVQVDVDPLGDTDIRVAYDLGQNVDRYAPVSGARGEAVTDLVER